VNIDVTWLLYRNERREEKQRNTDFPLLMILTVLAISSKDGLSDGSSAQHCFMRVNMPGCTPSDSCGGSGGR